MNIENDEGANLSSFCFMVRSCYANASTAVPAAGAAALCHCRRYADSQAQGVENAHDGRHGRIAARGESAV